MLKLEMLATHSSIDANLHMTYTSRSVCVCLQYDHIRDKEKSTTKRRVDHYLQVCAILWALSVRDVSLSFQQERYGICS